jgi:hypothetical protein
MISIPSYFFYQSTPITISPPDTSIGNYYQQFLLFSQATDNHIHDSLTFKNPRTEERSTPTFNLTHFNHFFAPFKTDSGYQSISNFFNDLRKKYQEAQDRLSILEKGFKRFANYLRVNYTSLKFLNNARANFLPSVNKLLAEPKN